MKIILYQIDPALDKENVKFRSFEMTVEAVGKVNPEIYYKAFSGEVDCTDLEALYCQLNDAKKPKDYFGHSLSVSDVVHVIDSDHVSPGYYFCDRAGFKSIPFEPKKDMEAPEALKSLQDHLRYNWRRSITPASAVIIAVGALKKLIEKESFCRFNKDGQCTYSEKPMACVYARKQDGEQ